MSFTPCGLYVPGPKITPNRFGLLSVVPPETPEDGHWEGGITWDSNFCTDIHSTVGFCPIPEEGSNPKIATRASLNCCADPFILYGSFNCPPVGRTAEDAFGIAQERLHIRENKEAEKVFWTGLTDGGIDVNPCLAFGNTTCEDTLIDLTPHAGPVGVVASFGVLESALGECSPGTGVIHANYGLASLLAANRLLYHDYDGDDNVLVTITGQKIVLGSGYPGTGPANIPATPGTTWVFATGPMVVWRSEVFLTPERYAEAMDYKLNSVKVYAERVYAFGWSCCYFAIKVSLCP